MTIFVLTCRKYYGFLKGFSFLFNRYWPGQEILVFGFESLTFDLPPNFHFVSIGEISPPAACWTNGLIDALQYLQDSHVIFMLEDYWLNSPVNPHHIQSLARYMSLQSDVLRMDLTGDRLHSGGAQDIGKWDDLDLIETPYSVQYQISLQAAIWNRRGLLNLVQRDMSPWEVELNLWWAANKTWKIQGTRQRPIRYTNAWGTGWEGPGPKIDGIDPGLVEQMKSRGMFDGFS